MGLDVSHEGSSHLVASASLGKLKEKLRQKLYCVYCVATLYFTSPLFVLLLVVWLVDLLVCQPDYKKKIQNGYPGNLMEDGSWPRIELIDF